MKLQRIYLSKIRDGEVRKYVCKQLSDFGFSNAVNILEEYGDATFDIELVLDKDNTVYDYCVFDPYGRTEVHRNANGWSNWLQDWHDPYTGADAESIDDYAVR